jgi:hypothetical protein
MSGDRGVYMSVRGSSIITAKSPTVYCTAAAVLLSAVRNERQSMRLNQTGMHTAVTAEVSWTHESIRQSHWRQLPSEPWKLASAY